MGKAVFITPGPPPESEEAKKARRNALIAKLMMDQTASLDYDDDQLEVS